MKSLSTLSSYYTDKSQNTSTANVTRGKELMNDQHRYLIQKYFDNLQTSYVSTVGGGSYTITATPGIGDTSATLTVAWALPTGYQLTNFSGNVSRNVLFVNGSTTITWQPALVAAATTAISTTGMQAYQLPSNVSKVKDITVSVGQLKFTPVQIQTQQEWDLVNFLPYTSDIPQYVYVYNNQINIFPVPSTTGNIITYNFKRRVADLTYSDYTTGTVAAAAGGSTVTGTATAWNSSGTYPLGVDLTYASLYIQITPPKGDGIWYQIRSFTSDTVLTLVNPLINNPIATGAAYTIGQFPLLQEDFHDMLAFGALKVYFGSINKQPDQFKLFSELYTERLVLLEDYAGTREVNVDLGAQPNPINPNLFTYAQS